jgi:predicted DNA-binding protein
MELSKKTTILFPPDLHDRLMRLAKQKGISLGQLVRAACEAEYEYASSNEKLQAVEELSELSLPVGTPQEMKREMTPSPEDLLP